MITLNFAYKVDVSCPAFWPSFLANMLPGCGASKRNNENDHDDEENQPAADESPQNVAQC